MYSRIPRQPPRPAGVPSYRQRVTPPPNYSGNAFPAEPDPDDARPRFDGLPTVSNLPARDMTPASEEPVSASAPESDADCSASASASPWATCSAKPGERITGTSVLESIKPNSPSTAGIAVFRST